MYGIPKHFEGCTWENWTPRPELADAVVKLREWDGQPWAILLVSQQTANLGTGKTRALCSTVAGWRSSNRRAFYLPVARILQIERQRMDANGEVSETGTPEWCGTVDAMIAFDDLGVEHDDRRGWAASIIEDIADQRYAGELPSIFATNLSERSVQLRYPRLWRRCAEGLILPWVAPIYHPIQNASSAAQAAPGSFKAENSTRRVGKPLNASEAKIGGS